MTWTEHEALVAITDVLEAHVREADRPKGGMSVPFHGDFVSALGLPSVVERFRWWARELSAALASEPPTTTGAMVVPLPVDDIAAMVERGACDLASVTAERDDGARVAEPSLLVLNTGRGSDPVCDYRHANTLLQAARAQRDAAQTELSALRAELEDRRTVEGWVSSAWGLSAGLHNAGLEPRRYRVELFDAGSQVAILYGRTIAAAYAAAAAWIREQGGGRA